MVSEMVTLTNPQGLHMRPADTFASAMAKFVSIVTVVADDKQGGGTPSRINGKSPMALMAAGLSCGTQIKIECEGPCSHARADTGLRVQADWSSMFKGVNASDGIGIGSARVAVEPDLSYVPSTHQDSDEEEKARYQVALDAFCAKTQEQADRMKVTVGEKEAEIMSGHIAMAQDPFMVDEVNKRIVEGKCAEQAVDEVCDMFYAMFDASDEQLIRERCADVQDVRAGILAKLLGKELVDLSVLPKDSIVVVHDLTPSMTATIDKENVAAVVTEVGGRTSHSAIICRALEIPAVLSVENACTIIRNNDTVVANGTTGDVSVNPTDGELVDFRAQAAAAAAEKAAL